MELFPDQLIEQTLKMPGAGHAYLKHLCHPDGFELRSGLSSLLKLQPEDIQSRLISLLHSLDNRRFFQGFAELVTLGALSNWTVLRYQAPYLEVQDPIGQVFSLAVLAFLQQRRPGGEEGLHKRLKNALDRAAARQRFAVLIRRWLPPELDPEPIRRAVELWQQQLENGQWQGRYATYEDDNISLEFSLTGEPVASGRSPVAFCLGPFFAHRTMEVLEPRVITELDYYRISSFRKQPLLLACVTDQKWLVNDNYFLEFFYGRPSSVISSPNGLLREYTGNGVCLFRDPLYPMLSGVWLLDRDPMLPVELRARSFLNPWSQVRLSTSPVRCFGELPQLAGSSVRWLGWQNDVGSVLKLGVPGLNAA